MRPFSRLTLPLVVSLGLASSASAAPFCTWLPEWAQRPCSSVTEGLWGSTTVALPARETIATWLPEGWVGDPNGRNPPPPAPAETPTEEPTDTL